MIVLSAGPASADDDPNPLNDVTDQVNQVVEKLLQPGDASPKQAAEQKAAAPVADDDDSPGYETKDPVPPDHASGEALSTQLAEQDLVSAGTTDSEIRDDHSAGADATALAIGGQEVIGAHAQSGGTEQQSAGDPLAPVCEGSDGAICATVLYADAEAHEGQTTSDSSARSGVAAVCVGGDDPTGETCSGPVGAGVLQSWSEISRDGSGHTQASSGSEVADLCVAPELDSCSVGAEALSSEGSSDSRGTASKESLVLGLELGGQGGELADPTAIAIPPGCTSPNLLCVFLNQGETYLGDGIAGHSVKALHANVLDGLVLADAAQSETLVHQAGPRTTDQPDGPGDGGPGDEVGSGGEGPGPGDVAGLADRDDALPNTGGIWSGMLAIGLLTMAVGGFLVAWARRRDLVDAAA